MMFSSIPERRMHWIRWLLTTGWLLIIASLFYDPWTEVLTDPNHPWSPFRLPNRCIELQGNCLIEHPYPLGTTLFWGAIVPGAILILLVFGHETWRRICPLSFLSQIPRALGWQRQFKRENSKTGKTRYELAKVKPDSWLGKHYFSIQFGWLFVGLCGRILFFNADRLFLALWILLTILAAIIVGYLYSGKSWCQYFCPMAPVQQIYSEPGGLFASQAHTSDQLITQSMCRTVSSDGKEQSACVACQNPCIDIDAERAYWDGLNKPREPFLRYGYVGLVIGYFAYYYLYAGNWDYYFSGAWSRRVEPLASLLSPGFFLFGQAINIPKIVAVPLTLGLFTLLGYQLGRWLEQRIRSAYRKQKSDLKPEIIRHRIFTFCTFGIFNFFFIFGGRPLVQLLPVWCQYIYDFGLVFLSTLWACKIWQRSPDLYSRENLTSRFRKQLEKLQLDVSQYLEGRSLGDLNTHEVYILARVLPGFTREKRHEAYKGVVREALEEGYVNYSSSLAVLEQLRQELGITEDEHREVLEELGIEDPELLNPDRQRSLENQIRLTGYQKSLERLILLQQKQAASPEGFNFEDRTATQDSAELQALRRQYLITPQDEARIFSAISPNTADLRRAEFLLSQLPTLIRCFQILHHPLIGDHQAVVLLLKDSIQHKQELIVTSILEAFKALQGQPIAASLVQQLNRLCPLVLPDLLHSQPWRDCLPADTWQQLMALQGQHSECLLPHTETELIRSLQPLLQGADPLVQSACLYLITQVSFEQGRAIAQDYCGSETSRLLKTTATAILKFQEVPLRLSELPLLEKVVHLFNSHFFHRLRSETLISLAEQATVSVYSGGAVITEAGDTCRELLLLIEGEANIQFSLPNQQVHVEQVHPGQVLDELEILAHSDSQNTITANSETTRILAIPVAAFDNLLDSDRDFARRVLELESRQLQRLVGSIQIT
jgi:CRP-like cAMP-binding protein